MNLKRKIYKKICGINGKFFPVLHSRILFYASQHKRLNLKNPATFNEKLMWLKINNYYNNSTVWRCADKYLVRDYAKKCGVEEKFLPKLLGVYNNANEIDFKKLPNKFALKCSHGCGFNIICTDKNKLDIEKTRKQLNKWLKTKFGYESAENYYTHIKPCIICEKFIESIGDEWPPDYKIYCFNGIPKFLLVTSERDSGKLRLNWYDFDWNELSYGHEKNRSKKNLAKPTSLPKMIKIAEKVSKDFPFVRVDFYEYNSKPIMGEMTFTPAANIATYYNEYAQKELGKMLNIKREEKK
jgi:hypothetical protein